MSAVGYKRASEETRKGLVLCGSLQRLSEFEISSHPYGILHENNNIRCTHSIMPYDFKVFQCKLHFTTLH